MSISYERVDGNYSGSHFTTISIQQSHLDYEPSVSSLNFDQSEYFDDCAALEDNFVSPISYDPSTGIYTPTYRAADTEFLRLYGQSIVLPANDGADSMDWNYESSSVDSVPLRTQDYPSNASNACQSSEPDPEDTDMLQYLASPVANHIYPSNFGSASSMSCCTDDAYVPPQKAHSVDEEDIIQPPMIVPSQQHLAHYLWPAQSQSAPEVLVSPVTYAPPAAGMQTHQPFNQDVHSPTAAVDAFPIVPSQPRSLVGLAIHIPEQAVPVFASSANTSPQMASSVSPTDDLHQCDELSQPPSPAHSKRTRRSPRAHTRSRSPSAISSRSSSTATVVMPEHQVVVKLSQIEKKPLVLACLFCRSRKIACAPALPGSGDTGCNQCARRHLCCEYPTESRRGMRRRPSKVVAAEKAAGGGGAKLRKRSVR